MPAVGSGESGPVHRRDGFGGIAGSNAIAPGLDTHAAGRLDTRRSSNPPRPVVGRGSPLFFGDVLEHRFVQEQFRHEPLEAIDFDLELARSAIVVDNRGVMSFSPAVIGGHGDAVLAADVRDRESLAQIAVNVLQQPSHFIGGPSLAHGSLPGKVYRGTPISGGPTFGEQVKGQPNDFHNRFHDLHPVRRIAILLAGPASLYLVAVLCLGPSKASPKVGRGFVQFVLPIVPRATAWAGGTPKELAARLLNLPQDQPSRVVLGIVASKLTAFNLFPIPPSCGWMILMTLLGWRKRLPKRAEVTLLTVGLLITVCLVGYWLVLIASFALKRT